MRPALAVPDEPLFPRGAVAQLLAVGGDEAPRVADVRQPDVLPIGEARAVIAALGLAVAGRPIATPARFELLADVRPEFAGATLMEAAKGKEPTDLDDDASTANMAGIERAVLQLEERGAAATPSRA